MGCRVGKHVEGIESAVEDLRTVTLIRSRNATLYTDVGVINPGISPTRI